MVLTRPSGIIASYHESYKKSLILNKILNERKAEMRRSPDVPASWKNKQPDRIPFNNADHVDAASRAVFLSYQMRLSPLNPLGNEISVDLDRSNPTM